MRNLTELSIHELQDMLHRKRKRPLKEDRINAIKEAIEHVRAENDKFYEKFVNSYMYKLAQTQLRREGRAEKIRLGSGCIYYDYDIVDILETMQKIVRALKKQESRDDDRIEKL